MGVVTHFSFGQTRYSPMEITQSLHEGLAVFSPDGKQWGYVDSTGRIVIANGDWWIYAEIIVLPDTIYDYIWPLDVNGHYYYGVELEGQYGVIEPETGELIVPWGDYESDEVLYDELAKYISQR